MLVNMIYLSACAHERGSSIHGFLLLSGEDEGWRMKGRKRGRLWRRIGVGRIGPG